MIRKGILTIIVGLLFIFAPVVSYAQTSDEVYRSYLLALIDLLQQQIIALQSDVVLMSNSASPVSITKRSSTKNFESFIIDDSKDIEARYEISDVNEVAGIENKIHRDYFERFFELVPDAYDNHFVDLLVFDERVNEIDGFVETVPPYHDGTWRVGINESVFEFETTSDLVDDLFIHEFAHLISYEGIQGTSEPSDSKCHEYFSELGCPPANSYLIDFMDEFWNEGDLDALVEFGEDGPIWTNREVQNNFVTDYASTNPAEDFAESFSFFVIDERSENRKAFDEKINYFYNFNYLVTLRDEIRSEI